MDFNVLEMEKEMYTLQQEPYAWKEGQLSQGRGMLEMFCEADGCA